VIMVLISPLALTTFWIAVAIGLYVVWVSSPGCSSFPRCAG